MKHLLLVCFFSISAWTLHAAHIIGSEVSYRYLGSNQYEISFRLLRDGNSTGANFDAPLTYTIFDSNTDSIVMTRDVFFNYIDTIPATQGDPCVVPPANYIIQMGVYIDTVNLDLIPGDYYVTYQRCCWANDIDNIVDPGSEGLTVTCVIPGTAKVATPNNSSVVTMLPPIVLCVQKEFIYDYSATDADGDSLVYSLCDPLGFDPPGGPGGNSPNPDFPKPYTPVDWVNGYATATQFGLGSPISIDPNTGLLTLTPNMIGRFLSSMCIQEYRNGVLLTEKSCLINFQIIECDKIIPFTLDYANFGIKVGNSGDDPDPTTKKYLSEDCGEHTFTISRDLDTTQILIELISSGTAINGVDYPFIEDTLIIPIGVKDTSIIIKALKDNLNESTESLNLNIRYFDICTGEYDSLFFQIDLLDYRTLSISVPIDSLNYCPDLGEIITLNSVTSQGIPPYTYDWYSTATEFLPDAPSFSIGANVLIEPVTPFYITVTDQCGKEAVSNTALVYDQCPIIVPNVITLNGDYVNDQFIIKNLENYEQVRLKVWNRWGQLLYENDNYKNNWLVTHKDGRDFEEGVYFYFAEVVDSKKYEYDNNGRTNYQAQGFFHVLKNE